MDDFIKDIQGLQGSTKSKQLVAQIATSPKEEGFELFCHAFLPLLGIKANQVPRNTLTAWYAGIVMAHHALPQRRASCPMPSRTRVVAV